MSQLSLFDSSKPKTEKRPPNTAFIRKHLDRVLRQMRNAEHLPWSAAEARRWQEQFPELAKLLPEEEAVEYGASFEREWNRLNAA